MLATVSGIDIDTSDEQSSNALIPIDCSLLVGDICTDVRDVHPF